MAERDNDSEDTGEELATPRPFWSGTVAFGLVSLPVSLYPANRGRQFSLRMVDAEGTPLVRRYFCEQEGKLLSSDEIVRGYELEDGNYVVIEDAELESLEPEKSREIDLTRFVDLDEIDPMYFERAYFLVPEEGATKAYRLLAKSMEDEQRAGIATFVMRGKEYLAAIVAEKGILRVETLRFHDEVRSAGQVGLPEQRRPAKEAVAQMEAAMRKHAGKRFDREELQDAYVERVMAHIEKKLKSGKDVVRAPDEVAEEMVEESNVVDLMQVLKDKLQGRGDGGRAGTRTGGERRSGRRGGGRKTTDLDELPKAELYERAQKLDIPGRSAMSKDELVAALSQRH